MLNRIDPFGLDKKGTYKIYFIIIPSIPQPGANIVINGFLVAFDLEVGIVVGSAAHAIGQTIVEYQEDCIDECGKK